MPEKPSSSYSVSALGSKVRKKASRKSVALNNSASQISSAAAVALNDSASQKTAMLQKLTLAQNLSDIPGGENWQLTAFLAASAQYDLARMSDEELEILAAIMPVGGCDA